MGLCPIGKFVFSNQDAIRVKNEIKAKFIALKIEFLDIDNIIPDGLVKDQSQVPIVDEHFKKADIDCLFIPHCNFGTEGAAGMIAKKLAVPTLLWGPRDESPLPDGTRLRDTLCGMFATSKVLHKLNVPFTYIENCRLDELQFDRGLDMFLRAAAAANVFRKGIKIGQIGQRIDFFWTTIVNESELLERFNIEILPIDMVEFIRNVRDMVAKNNGHYKKQVSEVRSYFEIKDVTDQSLSFICAMRDHILELAKKYELDGFAIQDFMSLVDEAGAYCFLANSMVGEDIAISCESDIHGAISSILLQKVSLTNAPVFLTDVTVRHPDDDNGVLLWHAGAPLSIKHPQSQVRLGHHWILPSPLFWNAAFSA